MCLVGEEAAWGADGKKEVKSKLIDQEDFEKLFKLERLERRGDHRQGQPHPALSSTAA